ncbi:MAG: hydantoinase B/oxoprolinase family protein [Alphaproteobacteria bacterium]|nr:hydantoinase B/oxoprolinase family protein [Alphaproteobacteria bacterium]
MSAVTSSPAAKSPSPSIDPVTVEVIGNAIASIADEMGEILIRASYSTNIKERRDCSTVIFDAAGRTLYQAEHIPMHLGSLMGVVEEILARHDVADIAEGDMFIGNDAYTGGGTHLPDIVLASPIFFEGRLVGWATNLAHHADFVDRAHAHIYQEGLRIPPIRLLKAGVMQQDVFELILLNCQVPHERQADLRAQIAANGFGVKRFHALCERYGVDFLEQVFDELLDYAERRMRAGIASIPDGVYRFEDKFECDEFPETLTFHVVIEVKGDEIHLDFTGNPPQVRASLNMVETALLATVYYAVKTVTDPDAPPNGGLFRPIKVTSSPGSILSASSPAAVNGRTNTCQRVVDLVHGALAPAIPERIIAACNGAVVSTTFSGVNPRTGQFYVYLETLGGGFGARATKDGLDGVHVHITNTSNLPIEGLEMEYPLQVERYELVQDSGGCGRWRGGMGMLRQIRILDHECRVDARGTRRLTAPWGLFGGLDGGRFKVESDAGEPPYNKNKIELAAGQSIAITTPGAGGYGPPAERCQDLVKQDLAEDRISKKTAEEIYGFRP